MQQSSHSTTLTSSLTPLPLDEILKNRPICMQKTNKPVVATGISAASFSKKQQPVMVSRTTPGKSASFRVSSNNTSVTSGKPTKPSASEHNLNISENSDLKQVKTTALNTSTQAANNTSRIRKKSESNCSISTANTSSSTANPGYLHTELRAFKRQEYDQSMREKEKMASLLKQELESDKLKKQQEEIQKIRMQRNFRSNPVKHYKPVELKPSVRPLTDPKSPQLSNSMLKLNSSAMGRHNDESMSNQSSSHRLSMALVDAPIIRKYNGGNMSKHDSQLQAKPRLQSKQRTLSQDDVRY